LTFPLDRATPSSLDLDPKALDRLTETITRHIAEGRYPGAQIAMARRGKLALFETIGDARIDPSRATASENTLWLLYSNTKVVTACAVWLLAERGALSFTDRVAEHLPGFEQNGKGDITALESPLQDYCRLRVGPYRVILTYSNSRTIDCLFAERRGIVYEVFAETMIERLLHDD